jgi:transcriptional regulator with XRE-family HTH domain
MTRLQELIRERGLKQRWLAEQLGVHESEFSRWVLGVRPLSAERAQRIAEILDVPADQILSCAADVPSGTNREPTGKAA